MHTLAFDDLRLFSRVAALGSLSAVARERDAPVSQVSRALARIEQRCGARLMHRSTHGLALTPEGITFLSYCERLIGTLDELEGDFSLRSEVVRGRVRVAASTVLARYQLLPSLAGLHALHPELRVDLEVADRQADMARDGIDIAIRSASDMPETMIARQIGRLGRALYAAPGYLAQAGTPQHPDELRQHTLIANSAAPHLNHWPFAREGQTWKLAIEGHWRANDSGLTASMVLEGLGIGRLAVIVAEPLVQQGRLQPVLAQWVDAQPIPIVAVTASNRQRLPKIRACLSYWTDWFARFNDAPPS